MPQLSRAALGWVVLVTTVVMTTLSGCGQKGDLYLPSDSANFELTSPQDTDFAS